MTFGHFCFVWMKGFVFVLSHCLRWTKREFCSWKFQLESKGFVNDESSSWFNSTLCKRYKVFSTLTTFKIYDFVSKSNRWLINWSPVTGRRNHKVGLCGYWGKENVKNSCVRQPIISLKRKFYMAELEREILAWKLIRKFSKNNKSKEKLFGEFANNKKDAFNWKEVSWPNSWRSRS